MGHLAAVALLALGVHAHAECKLKQIIRLPVRVIDLKPQLTTQTNGAEARFLIDSGASINVITPGKAAQFGLKPGPAPYGLTMTGLGGAVSVSVVTVRKLTIAGTTLSNSEFIVGGGEAGQDAAGLLGQNILGFADTDYDLANGVVRLIEPQGCHGPQVACWTQLVPSSLDLTLGESRLPLTKGVVFINGVRIRAIFDTGATVSILSVAAAKRAGVDPQGPGSTPGGLMLGAGRRQYDSRIVPVHLLKIGDEQIKHTRLRVGEMNLDDVDMLVGPDFFCLTTFLCRKVRARYTSPIMAVPCSALRTPSLPKTRRHPWIPCPSPSPSIRGGRSPNPRREAPKPACRKLKSWPGAASPSLPEGNWVKPSPI